MEINLMGSSGIGSGGSYTATWGLKMAYHHDAVQLRHEYVSKTEVRRK